MKRRTVPLKRAFSLSVLALSLFCLGCSDVYLSNPLDSIRVDQIAGRWADADGKPYLIIERGSGNTYNSWTPEDYNARKDPSEFFVAQTGGMLFVEQHANCTGHKFPEPDLTKSPSGCWSLRRIVLSETTLDYYDLDAMTIVRQSVGGTLAVANSYGVTVAKPGESPSAEVLLQGTPGELSSFLATFGQGSIYSAPTKLHRI